MVTHHQVRQRPNDKPRRPALLVLAPSRGLGGGVERVVAAVEQNWDGPVERVDFQRGKVTQTGFASVMAELDFTMRALVRTALLRPRRVIVIHVGLLPVGHVVGRLSRAITAVVFHGSEAWARLGALDRFLIRRTPRLIAVSRFTARWVARRAAVDERRVAVIRLPVSPELALAGRRHEPRRRPQDPVLLTVSRLTAPHRYKGHFEIAECLPMVIAAYPSLRWLVIGGGDDEGALLERCRTLGILDSSELRGNVADQELVEAYRAADIFVLPSASTLHSSEPVGEGFGLVYAEAAAFGVPSIASTEGGGALEFVEHDKTGITVPPRRPQALADAIMQLLADDDRRRALGEAARARTLEHHLPEHFASQLDAILS